MNWIEVNNGATRFIIDGNGSAPLVLIHEMGGSLESWEPLLPVIQKIRTVLRYDMPVSFGDASKLRGTASIDTLTNDLAALLDAVALAGPVDLCGMAVGGAVALHLAARHPHRVRGLVLMGPALGIDPARRSDVNKRADALEANDMSSIVDSELGLTYPDLLREATPSQRTALAGLATMPRAMPPRIECLRHSTLAPRWLRFALQRWCSPAHTIHCDHLNSCPRWQRGLQAPASKSYPADMSCPTRHPTQ